MSTRAIREAYATLRTLGVVEIKHGKGIFLSVFTRSCSEQDIAALDEIVGQMAVHYRDGTIEQFNEADFSFHTYIVNRSGNRIVRSLYFHLQNLLHQSIEVTQLYGGSDITVRSCVTGDAPWCGQSLASIEELPSR